MKKVSNKQKEKKDVKVNKKKFFCLAIVWLFIFAIGMVKKELQNDTFYTIKIGELILKNGIDMMDHFSFHSGLAYTYPHWLYDTLIYLIYSVFGFGGLYISSIILFLILLFIVFKINVKISDSYSVSAFATGICALAISGFMTSRAQSVSYILFALEIYFIEMFLKNGNKKNIIGLLIISLLICNVHVAVWPFYYILFLPYLAEGIISFLTQKIKIKKQNKFTEFLKNKFIVEDNSRIKYLLLIMGVSLLTGLLTPIGNTPYTYLIKTMLGNSQDYIQEHQMMTWIESPFTIIIAGEVIFLSFFSRVKLRDLLLVIGLSFMSIMSLRHLSLLALIGTICFSRVFSMFLEMFSFDADKIVIGFLERKKWIQYISFAVVIIFAILMLIHQNKYDYIDKKTYPVDVLKYIKDNVDIDNARIFNDYNFGSYLLLNDIPVFIDSRADLYTKQFSGFDYDIFDDYMRIAGNYQEKFKFYGITHVLIYKEKNDLYEAIKIDPNYKKLYDDKYFAFYEKLADSSIIITYN